VDFRWSGVRVRLNRRSQLVALGLAKPGVRARAVITREYSCHSSDMGNQGTFTELP
jgi:hypothetical protein